jgi:transcription initiation factor IIE alpha subunit
MPFDISIPCPVCQTAIPADSSQLITGVRFTCPKCQATIGLSSQSKEQVETAMRDFEQLKEKMAKSKDT